MLATRRQLALGSSVLPFVVTAVWLLLGSLLNAGLVHSAYGTPAGMIAGTYARYVVFAPQSHPWALATVSGLVTLALVEVVALAL